MTDQPIIVKLGRRIPVSREHAIEFGIVQPTPEERAAREAARVESDRRTRAAWAVYDQAIADLDAITDTLARAVLELHAPIHSHIQVQCHGCDADGAEAEYPEWPCRTVQAVAQHHDVELPEGWRLSGPRPTEPTPTTPEPPA